MKTITMSLFIVVMQVWVGNTESIQLIQTERSVQININEKPFAEYVFRDDKILRPYFAHIHAPNGVQVSRNHPPIKGKDRDDHADMHPGIWMAFGDINGKDYWRNKAVTKHTRFIEEPSVEKGVGTFSVLNAHLDNEDVVCNAEHAFTVHPQEKGVLLVWDTTFYSTDSAFVFGDQEEMGLGIRVATPVMAKNGGMILNQESQVNEKGVWGKQSDWCVYKGEIDGQEVGMMVMPSPNNFRQSWFHARDYGLLVANPFGRNAFTKQEKSMIEIKKDEKFHLQYGVYVFNGQHTDSDLNDIYQTYISTYSSN